MNLSNIHITRDARIHVGGEAFGFQDVIDDNFDPAQSYTDMFIGPWGPYIVPFSATVGWGLVAGTLFAIVVVLAWATIRCRKLFFRPPAPAPHS